MSAAQVLLPGRVAGQLVVSVKSPVMARVRGKGWVPMFAMVTDWVVGEVLVTRTGVGKVIAAGETVRLGLADWPMPMGCVRVEPVMRTVRFWAVPSLRVRVVESAEGAMGDW